MYFIQQVLKDSKNPLVAVSLRRMIPDLPQELQANLREALRKVK